MESAYTLSALPGRPELTDGMGGQYQLGALRRREAPLTAVSRPLLTADHLAALLRVPRSTVYELTRPRPRRTAVDLVTLLAAA